MAQPKTEQLNVRLPKSLLQAVTEVAAAEHLDRTALIRKLLAEGVIRYRLDHAVRLYSEARTSKARAAELAGVSIYDLTDEVERRGLRSPYAVADVRDDLELLRKRYGLKSRARKGAVG